MPKPEILSKGSKRAIVYFGATRPAVLEAIDELQAAGHAFDAMRITAFPFSADVRGFIDAHDDVFVVEQNRDGQMRSLLINELGIEPAKLVPLLNIDGMPLTAVFVRDGVLGGAQAGRVAAE